MTEEQFKTIWTAITNSAWGQAVDPTHAPALARDIEYALDQQ